MKGCNGDDDDDGGHVGDGAHVSGPVGHHSKAGCLYGLLVWVWGVTQHLVPCSEASCCENAGGRVAWEGETGWGGTMKQGACRALTLPCSCHSSVSEAEWHLWEARWICSSPFLPLRGAEQQRGLSLSAHELVILKIEEITKHFFHGTCNCIQSSVLPALSNLEA